MPKKKTPITAKVLLQVTGGVLHTIHSTDPNVIITVIDWDSFENGSDSAKEIAENAVSVPVTDSFGGDYTEIVKDDEKDKAVKAVHKRLKGIDKEFALPKKLVS